MRIAAFLLALLLPLSALAQTQAQRGTGAVVRALEKVSGHITDFTLAPGEQAEFERLRIEMEECRYPAGDPAADAYAYLVIRENAEATPLFSGWMIASSPALNAMDHPRYDVWVLRCTTD